MPKYSPELNRRSFLKKAGLTAAGLAACGLSLTSSANPTPVLPSRNKKAPNVLVIKTDEHNPFLSSIEGHPFIQTPNLQELANTGTYYKSHYTASPLCVPTRSSWISGLRPHKGQFYNNSVVFQKDYPSHGHVLREQGIYTVHVGKLDAYREASKLGFSEMHRLWSPEVQDPGDMNVARNPVSERPLESRDGTPRNAMYGVKANAFSKDEPIFNFAKGWISSTGLSLDQPWLMELNTSKPHFPCFTSQELWDLYEGHDDLPELDKNHPVAQHPVSDDLRKHFKTDQFTEEQVRGLRRGYYANVTYIDNKVGELINILKETGQLDNTVIIYTSDHGTMMGKYGMHWKSSMHEDSARVPCIISGPGFNRDTVSHTACDSMDLQATLFGIFGVQRPEHWDGEPLQGLALNDHERTALSEYHGHGQSVSSYAIRQGNWKYIYHYGQPAQLFNIDKDPQETLDLASTQSEKRKQLHNALLNYLDPDKEHHRAEDYIQKQLAAFQDTSKYQTLPGGHGLKKEVV
ncbi:sulfatase-like hydrolase/transferase [Endozoicomonas atrinae]|uniref:sulfatase-like hydrolase/transferase n=1 Tax=Endozoicomonas atrinae TaxID=1333660 RepID=UPI000825A144|nr:sulfatase-like hydrolase/transferase [Endozoicomonas atrinae]